MAIEQHLKCGRAIKLINKVLIFFKKIIPRYLLSLDSQFYSISNGELDENSVVRDFRSTAADGKEYLTNTYNLDVIISVGYRVKSIRGGTRLVD